MSGFGDSYRIELRGPLKSRPLWGLAFGTILGLCYSAVWWLAEPNVERNRLIGEIVLGSLTGTILGAALPVFRHKFTGGVVAGCAFAIGYFAGAKIWGESLENATAGMLLVGISTALVAWWAVDYRPR
jgi:hypothetical protein